MPKYRLSYSQPRPSAPDARVAIWERKEHLFEVAEDAEAYVQMGEFLRQGAVVCGATTHYRSFNTILRRKGESWVELDPTPCKPGTDPALNEMNDIGLSFP